MARCPRNARAIKSMTDIPSIQREDLWQYALRVYSLESVKNSCLWAQDALGANVNLTLLLMFLQRADCHFSEQYDLKQQDISTLILAISDSEEAIRAHRDHRKQLKHRIINDGNRGDCGHNSARELDYQQALDQELVMEKEQQSILVDALNRLLSNARSYSHGHMLNKSSVQTETDITLVERYLVFCHERLEQDLSELLAQHLEILQKHA